MEINRNQYFMVGVIVLLLGLQLRLVDSYVLNAETTRILAKQGGSQAQQLALFATSSTAPDLGLKVIHPPEWIGWCLISVGAVLILHSLAMRKPDA